jgi:hypothetical protein
MGKAPLPSRQRHFSKRNRDRQEALNSLLFAAESPFLLLYANGTQRFSIKTAHSSYWHGACSLQINGCETTRIIPTQMKTLPEKRRRYVGIRNHVFSHRSDRWRSGIEWHRWNGSMDRENFVCGLSRFFCGGSFAGQTPAGGMT